MKVAAALIVKGSNDEAKVLERALANIRPHVDAIFVTRTQLPHESKNRALGAICAKYGADISDFEWCYDFAAARNFNFAQVPKDFDYIIWMDADDMYRGLEKLKPTLAANPDFDAFGLWYLYEWDEFRKPVTVHRKTMIVKNNDCVEWVGRIHEDLREKRSIEVKLIDGIDRLHLTNTQRVEDSKARNLEIAKRAAENDTEDPRHLFNLGNAHFGMGNHSRAIDAFDDFILQSGSDQEKYLAHQRLSDVYRALGDHETAIRHLQIDIGLAPAVPDAYLQLAHQYFVMGNMDKAEFYCLQGLMRRPAPNAMIVYNPRDYDYNPMMLLARIYSQKNRPDLMLPLLKGCLKIYPDDENLKAMVKEGQKSKRLLGRALTRFKKLEAIKDDGQLRKELAKLPEDLQSHPAIAVLRNKRFAKTASSGRDLVIFCGFTAQTWSVATFEKEGVGGSEEAVIHLAREYATLGWNVTVYNNCGHKAVREHLEYNAEGILVKSWLQYRPYWEFNPRDKQDVVVLWRSAKPVDYDINAPRIFIDMHDVIPPGEFTPERLAKITKVMVKSKAHRVLFPNIPDDKIAVVHNGFESYPAKAEKDPYLIINTSSPDRSMDVMPALFKEIKKRVPKARMVWAYGWNVFKSSFQNDPKMMKWMEDTNNAMEDAGIENLGRLTQKEVGELYQKAAILAYPTEFYEISCISVLKAQAAHCVPITTDFAALRESNAFGFQVHSPKTKNDWSRPYKFSYGIEDEATRGHFVDAVVNQLTGLSKIAPKAEDVKRWADTYSWPEIARQWDALFTA